MQKVKSLSAVKNKDEITELQNDIKNSIKTMYIQNKKGAETINQYANMINTIKEEYALIYKENLEKKTIEGMKKPQPVNQNYISSYRQNYYKQPKERPIPSYIDDDENDDENVQYVVRRKRKPTVKKIIYEDYIDGEEPDINDQEMKNEEEKRIEETVEKKTIKKTVKKGITKTIKM